LDTTNHSDRCLEAFHCSSAVSGSCSIDSCPNGDHIEATQVSLYMHYIYKVEDGEYRLFV